MPTINQQEKLRAAIGQRLRRLRQDRHWTQTQLADLLGLSQNRLSEIEHGKGSVTAEQLLLILGQFNVPIDYFSPQKSLPESRLQNTLARLGASHLLETTDIVPSEQVKEAADAIRETLVTAESSRLITGLAPVIVNHAGHLNLVRIRNELAEIGLDHRLGWVLQNTVEAVTAETQKKLPHHWALRYRRALTVIQATLGSWIERGRPQAGPDVDILDSTITSQKSIQEVGRESSPISRHWSIVSSIGVDDFETALGEAR